MNSAIACASAAMLSLVAGSSSLAQGSVQEKSAAAALHVHSNSGRGGAPISLDDLLQQEGLAEARFSPAGDLLVFARSAPIAQKPLQGYSYAPLARQQIFIADLKGGAPREIAPPPGTSYSLPAGEVWSPDGRYLLLIAASDGEYVLASWDADSGRVRRLPGRLDSAFLSCAFLSGGRLAYATIARDAVQRLSWTQMLDGLNRKWRAAWGRDGTQPTVSSANPLFETTRPASGALMLADLVTGAAVKLSDGDYAHGAVHASPDGERFAAVRKGSYIPEAIFPDGRQGELQIFELSKHGAVLRHVFDDLDYSSEAIAWAPSGERLLVGAKHTSAAVDEVRLHEVAVTDGSRREIPSGALAFNNHNVQAIGSLMPIGWIGDQPAAIAASTDLTSEQAPAAGARLEYGETRNRRFDLYVFQGVRATNLTGFAKTSVMTFLAAPGRREAFVTADGALWRVSPGKPSEQVSAQAAQPLIGFGVVRRPAPTPLSRAYHRSTQAERIALWGMNAQGAPEYLVLDLRSGRLQSEPHGELMDTAFDLSSAAFKVTEDWVVRLVLDDGEQRSLATFNAGLADRPVAHSERFTYRVGDSTLSGWVLTPPGARRGVPLPAVAFVYGGMVWGADLPMFATTTLPYPVFSGQLLAAHGYSVIYPSTPLGAGATSDLPETLAQQVGAAVEALAARGVVDPDRVGVMGQSFGGFSTAAILSRRSDRFRAGVALAGVYDFMAAYGMKSVQESLTDDGRDQMLDMELIETGQVRLGKPFWTAPEPYIRNSPIFRVEDIDSPLLIMQGDLDNSMTSLPGAERMYNALLRAGKHPVLVRYWGEGHTSESEAAIRDQWSRITTWFGHYLRCSSESSAASGQ